MFAKIKSLFKKEDKKAEVSNIEKIEIKEPDILDVPNSNGLKHIQDENFCKKLMNDGNLAFNSGNLALAKEFYNKVLSINKNYVDAYLNLGLIAFNQQNIKESIDYVFKALAIDENNQDIYDNLTMLLEMESKYKDALNIINLAIKKFPLNGKFYFKKGVYHFLLSENFLSIESLKKSKSLNFDVAELNIYSIKALSSLGFVEDLEKFLNNFISENKVYDNENLSMLTSMYLFSNYYFKNSSLKTSFNQSLSFNNFSKNLDKYPLRVNKNEKIRVGFVSRDLRNHPIYYFLKETLLKLNKEKFETYAYYMHPTDDDKTNEFKKLFNVWRNVSSKDSDIIYNDNIDILIDLGGHSYTKGLELFYKKPAKIQMTWLGYWGTLGIKNMDYIILDENSVKPEEEQYFSEKVLYLPESRFNYFIPEKNDNLPIINPPVVTNNFITFGTCQNILKINDEVVKTWSIILNKVPNSKLSVKSFSLDNEESLIYFKQKLKNHNVNLEQVILSKSNNREDYLKWYDSVDILLDTFPYTGGTTTCDAIFKGVPTLTLYGDNVIARQGAGMMKCVGLDDWITYSIDEYIQKAVEKSSNVNQLISIKHSLRDKMSKTSLFNSDLFVPHFELLLQKSLDDYFKVTKLENIDVKDLLNKGNIALSKGNMDEAQSYYQKIVNFDNSSIDAHMNLGWVLFKKEKFETSKYHLEKVLSMKNDHFDALYVLSQVLLKLNNDKNLTIKTLSKVLELNKDFLDVYQNLSVQLAENNQLNESLKVINDGIAKFPNDPQLYFNKGLASYLVESLEDSLNAFEKSIQLGKKDADGFVGLTNCYVSLGMLEELLSTFEYLIHPDNKNMFNTDNLKKIISSYIFNKNYMPGNNLEEMFKDSNKFLSLNKDNEEYVISNVKNDKIRLGFLSSDLKTHPVYYFLINIFKLINKDKFQIYAYYTGEKEDDKSQEFKKYCHQWKRLDENSLKLIKSDNIDILIDLAGHSSGNSLDTISKRLAKIQMTWLGYWGTLGVKNMDYIILDENSVKPEEEKYFHEKVLYLPETRFNYFIPEKNDNLPIVNPPVVKNNFITFGTCQNILKINDEVMKTWSIILNKVPNSKLVITSMRMQFKTTQNQIKTKLDKFNIDKSRVVLVNGNNREDYLKWYDSVDILLDTFPYTGGTTTCDAIFKGVPTLTLYGDNVIARQGAGMMKCVGLDDWIAYSIDEYIQKAVEKSSNINELISIKHSLRDKMSKTSLFNSDLFIPSFELLLQKSLDDYNSKH